MSWNRTSVSHFVDEKTIEEIKKALDKNIDTRIHLYRQFFLARKWYIRIHPKFHSCNTKNCVSCPHGPYWYLYTGKKRQIINKCTNKYISKNMTPALIWKTGERYGKGKRKYILETSKELAKYRNFRGKLTQEIWNKRRFLKRVTKNLIAMSEKNDLYPLSDSYNNLEELKKEIDHYINQVIDNYQYHSKLNNWHIKVYPKFKSCRSTQCASCPHGPYWHLYIKKGRSKYLASKMTRAIIKEKTKIKEKEQINHIMKTAKIIKEYRKIRAQVTDKIRRERNFLSFARNKFEELEKERRRYIRG